MENSLSTRIKGISKNVSFYRLILNPRLLSGQASPKGEGLAVVFRSALKIFCFFIFSVFAACTFISCNKIPVPAHSPTFLKTYESDSTALPLFIEQAPDGSFFAVAIIGNSHLILMKTKNSGEMIWTKTILKSANLVSGPVNAFNSNDYWHFIAQCGNNFWSFDTTGHVLSNSPNYFSSYNYAYSVAWGEVIQNGNTIMMSAAINKVNPNNKYHDYIYTFDLNLNLVKTDSFQDSQFGQGVISNFTVAGTTSSGDYKILGNKQAPPPLFNKLQKLYAATIPSSGKGSPIVTEIDDSDKIHSDVFVWQCASQDSGMILVGGRINTQSNLYTYPIIVKFDKNNNEVWEHEYPENSNTFNIQNINLCSDGGFIVSGGIGKSGYFSQPYALKIDKYGNKQWDKTLNSISGSGEFCWGIDLADGGYAFIGNSSQFGYGLNNQKTFILRTDANRNF